MDLGFNRKPSTVMHIDINSCFASIEQQANPLLRDKPIAVSAYDSPNGVILAPSVEAKTHGIKTGMRVKDARKLFPKLITKTADPEKYRFVHKKLEKLLSIYTDDLYPKSIDEFVLDLNGYPALQVNSMQEIGREIKLRIKAEIGDFIRVSIGIGPSRFIAKMASNYKKPDGLTEINVNNYLKIYKDLELTDLHGINIRNRARLNAAGIVSVMDFYRSPLYKINEGMRSIGSYYWYLRLRGWEIDGVEFARRTYGQSYSIPENLITPKELRPILSKLINKACARMRKAGYKTSGIHVGVRYKKQGYWHEGKSFDKAIFDSREIFEKAYKILQKSPSKLPVRNLSISCFNLVKDDNLQLEFFSDEVKRKNLIDSFDQINDFWGKYTIIPANMANTDNHIKDSIAFGK